MLKPFQLCATLLAVGAGSLFADSHPSPGSWEITGEFLYMMPTLDDTYFVIESDVTTTSPNGTRLNNDFNFKPGFRVGGAYSLCECDADFSASYTYLKAKQNKTVSGDFLWATVGSADLVSGFENYAGTASSRLNLLYERVDASYDQLAFKCCGTDVYVKLGLEAAFLKLNENYAYQTNATSSIASTVHQSSRSWGVGPQIGFEFDYALFSGSSCSPGTLSLNVLSTGSLLVGESHTTTQNTVAGVATVNIKDKKTTRIVPALHARVGLNYETTISCLDTAFGLGYEFSSYLRGLSRSEFGDDVADGLCSTNYYNFDVQGLYINATVAF